MAGWSNDSDALVLRISSDLGSGPAPTSPSALINCSWLSVLKKWMSQRHRAAAPDLLSQPTRLLPEIIDKLTPKGQLPAQEELRIAR